MQIKRINHRGDATLFNGLLLRIVVSYIMLQQIILYSVVGITAVPEDKCNPIYII